jgi:hypothetical protein
VQCDPAGHRNKAACIDTKRNKPIPRRDFPPPPIKHHESPPPQRKAKVNIMENSINNATLTANLSANLPADTEENRARRQLLFLAALFIGCATVGYLRMGDLSFSTQGVPLLGTLLGM